MSFSLTPGKIFVKILDEKSFDQFILKIEPVIKIYTFKFVTKGNHH